MRSDGRLEKRRLGNLVHPPILAEDQDGGLVAPKGQAHRVLGNHLGALHLVNVIMVLNPAGNLPLLRCTDHKQLLSQLAAPVPPPGGSEP